MRFIGYVARQLCPPPSRKSGFSDGRPHSRIPDLPVPPQQGTLRELPRSEKQIPNLNVIRNIISFLILTALSAVTLQAEPTPTSAPKTAKKEVPTPEKKVRSSKTISALKVTPAAPVAEGWSVANGEWVHSDGYKYVKGQVIRTGSQTHKRPPKPPTPAQLDAGRKRKAPPTAADASAAKAAEKERNLRPRPAPQTGTHL